MPSSFFDGGTGAMKAYTEQLTHTNPVVGDTWHVAGKPELPCTILAFAKWQDIPWVMFGHNHHREQVFTMSMTKFTQYYEYVIPNG